MEHKEFLEKVKKGLGTVPSMEARSSLAELIRTGSTRIYLRYEWIKDKRFFEWANTHPEIDIVDGEDGAEFFVIEKEK